MRAMWAAFAAIIVVSLVVGVVLDRLDKSTAETFAEPGVRPPAAQEQTDAQ